MPVDRHHLLKVLLAYVFSSMLCTQTTQAQQGSLDQVRRSVRNQRIDQPGSGHERDREDDSPKSRESKNPQPREKGKLQQVRHQVGGQDRGTVNRHQNDRNDSNVHHRRRKQPVSARNRRSRRRERVNFHLGFGNQFRPCRYPYARPAFIDICEPVCVQETVVVFNQPSYQPQQYLNSPQPAPPVFNSAVREADMVSAVDYRSLDEFMRWGARGSLSIGADFDDLSQFSFSLLLQEPGSIGLDLSVTTLREQGFSESLFSFRDNLWIGDANLVFEPLCTSDVRARIGVGINWMADAYGSDAGLNLAAGLDWKLSEKLTLSAEGDIGTLGEADFWHGRLSLAQQLGCAEWITGIDHYNIGGVNLHNFFTGFGFRF